VWFESGNFGGANLGLEKYYGGGEGHMFNPSHTQLLRNNFQGLIAPPLPPVYMYSEGADEGQ
jgi:hypothetical protein